MSDGHDADVGLYKRALQQSEEGDLAGAAAAVGEAIALRGDVPWYHHTLGEIREQQGDLVAARHAYARALALNPVSSKYRQAVTRVSARLADAAAPEAEHAATKPRLLIVEDSEVTRNWYERVLRADYGLSFATTARGAIRALPSVRPALILLDWQLDEDRSQVSISPKDGMDLAADLSHNSSGLDVCKQIKRSPYRHIPILMLTSKKSLIDKTLGKMARADRYLTKPVTAEALLATIRELLAPTPSGRQGPDPAKQ
jgi:twitching motility two-component system response regulator PilG